VVVEEEEMRWWWQSTNALILNKHLSRANSIFESRLETEEFDFCGKTRSTFQGVTVAFFASIDALRSDSHLCV
jgi:hypothetical protein